MPIYEYTCSKCKKPFEKLMKSMNSDQKIECPNCGSRQTERKLSTVVAGASKSKASMPVGCGRCGSGQPCAFES